MAEKRDKNKDKSKKSDKGKEVAAKAVPSKEIPKVVEAVKAELPSPVTPEPIQATPKAKEAEVKPKVNTPAKAESATKAPVASAKTKAEAPKAKPETAKTKAAAPVAKAGAAKPKAEAAIPVADRAKAALEKTAAKAAAIAEARKLALEKAQAELEARRAKWQIQKEEVARAQAERLTKAKESRAQRDAERQKAREEAAKSAADRVATAKAERDKATAERQKASQLAREEARAQADAQRKARLANAKAPTSTAAVKPAVAKPATKATAAPAAKETPAIAPVAIEIGYSLPAELKAELGKALKAGAKSTSLQVLGYFALPEGVDARLRGKLELARRKIAKGLEDAIIAVVGALVAEPGSASKLAFNPANNRVSLEFSIHGLNAALKRGLAAPTREISAQFAADVAAPKHFPALGGAVMLQFFGDLGTGQQLDGSLTFSADLQKPGESTLMYIVSLGNSGKKSVSPNIKLQFSHDLGLSRGNGSLSASFVVEVPKEAAKS